MAKIAIFTERSTLRMAAELNSLFNFRQVALELGHNLDFIFKDDIKYLKNYDAIFIRALTDPLNNSYVVSRMAELNGIRVIDKSSDIRICSDKVNMYSHLQKANVPHPSTAFLKIDELSIENARDFFESQGIPLVLKAPNSSFSAYVEKVSTPDEFLKIGKKFFRRADIIIVQQYLPSRFDWRVVLLDRKVISVVKYIMDPNAWKIVDHDHDGKILQCTVEGMDIDKVNPKLIETALAAGNCIGDGLYGVDLKEVDNDFYVIEVNDNPNIDQGLEDQKSPLIYEWIINYLVGQDFGGL
jgi:glutathione synthase/RimK-type ligase-like ATP-grasp enzyme